MKDIIKYSFSILIMISCLILFTIMAFKTIVFGDISGKDDNLDEPGKQEQNIEVDKEPEKDDRPVKPDKVKPEDAPFTTADASYFNDALFIGDSRTMGLKEYGQMEGAEFFANTGMSVYNVKDKAERCCYYCGTPYAERHEVFGGPNRQISIDNGFQVDLCPAHHREIQDNITEWAKKQNRIWRKAYQTKYERTLIKRGATEEQARESFIMLIGRSYL